MNRKNLFLALGLFLVSVLLANAVAFAGGSSSTEFGTLEQEKAYYRSRGWTWTPNQEPHGPNWSYNPSTRFISEQDVHGDLEADDLWQNLMMWKRTGVQAYYDLATSWARYYRDEYPTAPEFGADLGQFGGDHLFGWGLIDWWRITGDQKALESAMAVGEYIVLFDKYKDAGRCDFAGQDGCDYFHYPAKYPAEHVGLRQWARYYDNPSRQAGRHLRMVAELWSATGDQKWKDLADRILNVMLTTAAWDSRGAYAYYRDEGGGVVYNRAFSTLHFGIINDAFWRYYELTQDAAVRQRLVDMANFAKTYGYDPVTNYGASSIALDHPAPGQIHYSVSADVRGCGQVYMVSFIDTLMRGWKLTGDTAFKDRAYYYWERASKCININERIPDNQLGRFINMEGNGGFLSDTYLYTENGDLPYTWMLFRDMGTDPTPTTYGSARILRVGASGSTSSAPDSSAWIDSGTPSAANPLDLNSLTSGAHTVSVSNVSGYSVFAGTCTYEVGGQECQVSSFSERPSCSGAACTRPISVSENRTTKVVFKYVKNASLSLTYLGKVKDRVGKGNYDAPGALAPNEEADGVFETRLNSGSGNRTVTSLDLRSAGGGIWDTLASTSYWVLGVAASQDGSLLNSSASEVNFNLSDGGTFYLFANDLIPPGLFGAGVSLTLTVNFSDGTTATASTTINDSHCVYSIDGEGKSFPASGGTGSVSVTAPGGCSWSASSNVSWITITSGQIGTGNGTVGYGLAANTSGASGIQARAVSAANRTGALTIAGKTFTVIQEGEKICNYSFSPSGFKFIASGGTGSVGVATGKDCTWTAATNASWITITSGQGGTGNGRIQYSVSPNLETMERTGTMTVAGKTFILTQKGCAYSISPSGMRFSALGGMGSIAVRAEKVCAWTASSNTGWITISSGGSGTGVGKVSYSVSANPGTDPRTGTMTVAGKTFTVI